MKLEMRLSQKDLKERRRKSNKINKEIIISMRDKSLMMNKEKQL